MSMIDPLSGEEFGGGPNLKDIEKRYRRKDNNSKALESIVIVILLAAVITWVIF